MGVVLAALDPPDYLIQSNGANISEEKTQSIIYNRGMSYALFQEALPIVSQSDLGWHCFIDGVCYTDSRFAEPYRMFFLKNLGRQDFFTFCPVTNLAQRIVDDKLELEKMAVLTSDASLRRRIMEELEACSGLSVSSATSFNIEINSAGVNKGAALCALAAYLDVPMDCVAAFGDNLNDLSMLTTAGISVAMSNGLREVIDQSKYVTSTNNDCGVARFLAKELNIGIHSYC